MLSAHCDQMVPGLQMLADAVHAEGGRVALQINHGGRQCDPACTPETMAPSAIPTPTGGTPREMTLNEIVAAVDAFALAARRAQAAGFDAVESYLDLDMVDKAHIIDQFQGGLLLWANQADGRILGAQALAPRAADMIHEVALAVRCHLTVHDLANLVHVYPTISDGWRLVARKCQARLAAVNPY